ncbi:histidine kinase [Pedobacter ginsenosidimutans]|uniref:histidine kinase n=1 Tax=Pedobacter ginsenosidimutans TaxID=687842 RepID=A0A0T5VUF5_9SPHI|nr:tetratricopeptide repeat-containing sensor histidine kinase [Pedobacter ginsenosidimutans]KRT17474.1 histidine kinase [Pedobacter ginsenosidimutans]
MKKIYFLLFFLLAAFACKKRNNTQAPIKNQNFEIAESFFFKNNDSSFYYFNKVTTTSKDSLQVAMAYNYMAVIQSDAGDYFGGQESLTLSLGFLNEQKETDLACLASNYNELGLNSTYFKKYTDAINYYNLALKFCRNDSYKLQFLNNKALAYQKSGAYSKAIDIYNEVLAKISNKKEYARVLSNAAKTKWLQNPNYNPLADFSKALQIRYSEKDEWGQNASYSHLADYYEKKKPDSAFSYLQKMYLIATKLNSPDDRLEALQKLIKLSPAAATKQYFQKYQNIDDSLQTARSAAKNQFALIRYDTEKSKADNLVLQKDNEGKRYQIIILIFGIVLLIVVGTLWYKKRKQRLELEAQNTIRENKLKTSQKVHDVVANGLYRIMSKLDNQETLKDNPIVNEIEELYEQSRDLSYERPKSKNQAFNEKIADTLKSFASESTRVVLVGNSPTFWEMVSEQAKDEVEHILQELMVNMDKHSQASDVVIKFEQAQQKINIYYTDNGIGISGKVQPNNGLTNTGTRIAAIGGTITFDTNVEKGLKIKISFPVS